MDAALVAVLFGTTVYLILSSRGAPKLRRLRQQRSSDAASPAKPGQSTRAHYLACGLLAVVLFWVTGVPLGIVLAPAVAVGGPLVLRRFESRETRQRRRQLEANAALVCDMFVACLASGSSVATAAHATARALEGEIAVVLDRCVAMFRLGAAPAQIWEPMNSEPALAPIARAILRSSETGAPLVTVLQRVGEDLRVIRKASLDQAARAVGVKAVAPLGLCFLPAFMLLGVVPLVASLILKGISG